VAKETKEQRNLMKRFKSLKRLILLLLALLLIMTALSSWLFLSFYRTEQKSPLGREERYSRLNPARKLYDRKDLIINIQPLRDVLSDYEKDPDVSIYFEYLTTGANISVNKDAEFWPASLTKVPIAMAAVKKIERGEWKWTNELVLLNPDKDELFGDLYKQPVGTRFTIERLLEEMLVHSDNTAKAIILRNLDPTELEDVHTHLGLEKFFSEEGKISAKRYAVIFRALYNASYLSDEFSEKIFNWLSETPFNDYIVSGLPAEIAVSHKIGISDQKNVFLDAGIIYVPSRPYLLTVMVSTTDQVRARQIIRTISEQVYSYISKYNEAVE
jgi:beta-lactamase class A